MSAAHSWIPHKKWNYIKEAMAMFQEAIESEPENIEMRFLKLYLTVLKLFALLKKNLDLKLFPRLF